MFWLNFFRKKKKLQEDTKKISVSELKPIITTELDVLDKKIQNIREQVRQSVLGLISELREDIAILQQINLEDKKEQERIKIIVQENLKMYCSYLNKLTEDLEKLLVDKDYFANIFSLLDNFKIKSSLSFSKSTILIGKELNQVKDLFKEFTKEFQDILTENKDLIEREKLLHELNGLLLELEQIKDILSNLAISQLEKDLEEINNKKSEIEKSLMELTNNSVYQATIVAKEQNKQERANLSKENLSVKQEIDLKFLSKHFHSDIKKSSLIKNYIENFSKALAEDENLEIISLMQEAKINFPAEKLKILQYKNRNFHDWQETEIEKQFIKLEEEKRRLLFSFLEMQTQIEREKKKKERFEKKIEDISLNVKDKAREIFGDKLFIDS